MPLQIALSHVKALPFDFEKEVVAFIKAKQDHRTKIGEAAPSPPHALVEVAVRRVPGSIDPPVADDFVADYAIVDDTPPPPSLDQRKAAKAAEMAALAQAAIARFSPPLKRRLMDMDYRRALAVDEDKRSNADKATIAAALDRGARTEAISYHLATLEAQIHDLTDAAIDDWSPAPFPCA
jgi:hypothetical protein